MRDATHGQVVVGDAAAGGFAADAEEDRAAGGAVVVEELEVPLLEPPVVLQSAAGMSDGAQVKHSCSCPQIRSSRECSVSPPTDWERERELTYSGGEVVEELAHPPLVLGQVPAAAAAAAGGGERPDLDGAREEEGEKEGDEASARAHHRLPIFRQTENSIPFRWWLLWVKPPRVTAAWQDRVPTLRERRPVMAQPRRARTDRQRVGWSPDSRKKIWFFIR